MLLARASAVADHRRPSDDWKVMQPGLTLGEISR
jgi:hypothetical protein